MKWFYNLKIGQKLIISFVIVSIVAAVVGIVGMTNIKELDNSDTELYEKMTVPMHTITDIMVAFLEIRINERNILLTYDTKKIVNYNKNITEAQNTIKIGLDDLDQRIISKEVRDLYNNVVDKNNSFNDKLERFQEMIKNNQRGAALSYQEETSEYGIAAKQLKDALEKFEHAKLNDAKNKADQNTVQANFASLIMGIVIVIGVIIAMGLGLFLNAMISKPMIKLAEAANQLAEGNVNMDIKALCTDEIGKLMNSFNKVTDNLKALIKEMGTVSNAAIEGNLELRGNEQQFNGSYKEIVQGFNRTLDFVVEPVNEATGVLKQMANGNLKVRVIGNYQGAHAEIKNALNDTLDTLTAYISEISSTLNEMAHSNLAISIHNEYKGDFSEIKEALNLIISSLNQVMGEVNSAAEQVSAGSTQVSSSSILLSQGATEQASSIEELTTSVEQIAGQTRQNATNANEAKEIAEKARNNAVEGNVQMQEMLKAMVEINDSSSSISKIIKVIDDIAFQTNILALNAAVEAARAGQHGKGFAVVAEEVRNLAARSADAAKETTMMIEGSIRKAEGGTRIANVTAEALNNIVEDISKASYLVDNIAKASEEQALAVEIVNQGIIQIADVVQTTSATSQETAAASEELSSQAEMLKKQVNRFKLKQYSSHEENKGIMQEKVRLLA